MFEVLSLTYTVLSSMRMLLVDTADSRGFVALCGDAVVEGLAPHPADQDYSSWLLPAVHALLAGANVSLADLDAYAVTSGPGSFTGLRIGLTTVKAWAEIFTKPIVAVSRLDALAAHRPHGSTSNSYVAAYLDAQRDQVFAALFNSDGTNPVQPETVISLSAFVENVSESCGNKSICWRTPDPELLTAAPEWPSRLAAGDTLEPVAPPFSQPLCSLAYRKLIRGHVSDALTLDANYVRRADAEIYWKANPSATKI